MRTPKEGMVIKMNELKAIRCRIAARWLIFGSFIIGLLACVIRLVLVLNHVTGFEWYVLPNGVQTPLPFDVIILIAAVAVLMLIGVIFLIRSVHLEKSAAKEDELSAKSEGESESAYIEEDIAPAEGSAEESGQVVTGQPEATEETTSVQDAGECVRISRRRKDALKKGSERAKKAVLIAIPVVLAVAATTVVLKSAERRRREKMRRKFYDWIG